MIHVKGLTKSFGNKRVLHNIDMEVGCGEFLTVFGPNGAGKSTLLHILAGVMRPSSGQIRIDGVDVKNDPVNSRRRIGFVSHQSLLYNDLTASENLTYYGRMFDVPNSKQRIADLLRQVGLEVRTHDPLRTLSRGMVQRLAIARALLHSPSVLLLDEPFTGLDHRAVDILREILTNTIESGGTVIMATHNLERGLELCHRAFLLATGRLVYEAKGQDLDVSDLKTTFNRYAGGAEG